MASRDVSLMDRERTARPIDSHRRRWTNLSSGSSWLEPSCPRERQRERESVRPAACCLLAVVSKRTWNAVLCLSIGKEQCVSITSSLSEKNDIESWLVNNSSKTGCARVCIERNDVAMICFEAPFSSWRVFQRERQRLITDERCRLSWIDDRHSKREKVSACVLVMQLVPWKTSIRTKVTITSRLFRSEIFSVLLSFSHLN